MSPVLAGLLGLSGLFVMIFLRVPIGVALGIAGAFGYWVLSGYGPMMALLGSIPFDVTYNYDLTSFFQANPVQTEALMDEVLSWSDPQPDQTVLDLYAGVGHRAAPVLHG